jgi:glycine dehydrogenase subunit 1
MHRYLPHTSEEISAMLASLRLRSIEDLFTHLPQQVRFHDAYTSDAPLSDGQIRDLMARSGGQVLVPFRGFGSYDHERPAIIDAIASRQEFLTSYTPYQPEVAQGTLQYIFEFQSIVCELTGLDVSNASMYDGATSAAEAMMMAVNVTGISRILVASDLLPHVIETIKTYAHFRGVAIDLISFTSDGQLDFNQLTELSKTPFAAFLVAYPNRYGIIADYQDIQQLVRQSGALLIAYADLLALSVFKQPASFGADICCGEAQSLGIPLSFGGPYVGYLATINKYVRKMPGRICGITLDNRGQRSYVLTLQAREQHIRREKANSNICSNQSLMALQATIYAVTLGKTGLRQVAISTISATRYLHDQLIKTQLFTQPFKQHFAFETTLDYVGPIIELNQRLIQRGYLGGMPLGEHRAVFYASEKMSKQTIDAFVNAIKECHDEIR